MKFKVLTLLLNTMGVLWRGIARQRICRLAVLALLFVGSSAIADAQVALKTNIISDATLSPNLGVEVGLSKKFSLDVSGQVNFWTVDGHKWKHWLVQPEGRYWFCQPFGGHFVGLHALGGEFNVGNFNLPLNFLGTNFRELKDNRYQGWMAGVGVAYGYAWMLHKHWNLEAEIGIGWIYNHYDKYECLGCGRKTESGHHNYFGPTKAAINLVYIF